jgi:peptide/nickel transport system substrate-binding protein
MSRKLTAILGIAAAALFAAAPVHAQKSKNELRIVINDMFGAIDPYNFPHDEGGSFYRTIYDNLINFDEWNGKFVPNLAKSWKRIDDSTIEFDLRDDVTFHNGDKFTAEDVKATTDWLADEKTKIRFKDRYDWARTEILSPYKIRIHTSFPFSTDLSALSYRVKILDGKVMKTLEGHMEDYGRFQPVATGAYKVVDFDKNRGLTLEAVANHWDKSGYGRAPAQRVHGIPIPDRQTQVAQLITGGVDLLRNVQPDTAAELKAQGFVVTPTPAQNLLYVTLDAAGRSKSKLMTDERVRKAFIMAIPREQIVKTYVPGGDTAEVPLGICFKKTVACEITSPVIKYDPDGAKKLLAEAGYPNGVDLRLDVFEPSKQIAEAIAGEVRKVGFRTTVNPLTLGVYVKMRGDGEFTSFVGYYPTSTQPDVANLLDFFFGQDRDYWQDDSIHKAMDAGNTEFDTAKRTKLYTASLNKINEKAYILPVSELPLLFASTKEVKVLNNNQSSAESRLGDYAWSDYKEVRPTPPKD